MSTEGDHQPEPPFADAGDADRIARRQILITDEQRNGSIAGIALLLGFSLSFTAAWSQGGDPWRVQGLVTFALAAAGITYQLKALLTIFALPNISVVAHRRAASLFLRGVAAVLIAYLLHIALDAARDLGLL